MKRVKDSTAMRACLLREPVCAICPEPSTDPHHVLFRSHGGDDLKSNLVALCRRCHDLIHSEDPVAKRALGDHILTDRWDILAYLQKQLGPLWRDWYHRRLNVLLTIGEEANV